MRFAPSIVVVCLLSVCGAKLHAQAPTPPVAVPTGAPTADSWPRVFNTAGFTVTVYPPTMSSWDSRTLAGTCAFSRTATDGSALTYGTLSFTASTEVNRLNRMVTLTNLTITGISLPDNPADQAAMQSQMQAMAQSKESATLNVPLDRLEAAVPTMSSSPHVSAAPLQNVPPAITVTSTPTVLVPIQGMPVFKAVPNTKLQRVINTQMLLVRDQSKTWWLKIADGWMTASAIGGPWKVGATNGNADLATASKWASTQPTINLLTGTPAASTTPTATASVAPENPSLQSAAPAILVSTIPSEVIVMEGDPKWEALGTSGVEYVTNTGGNIFRLSSTSVNYVLVSGRWFTASTLAGPWTYVPAASVPVEFRAIPQDSPKENALASVPGTAQAQEASIANAIPQMARVPKTQAFPAPVVIGGKPTMVKIGGTLLEAVSNSSVPIFMVSHNQSYAQWYALKDGVWFTATALAGPWTVAQSVASEIYAIPPSSQYYYVTFVRVYSTADDYVLVGYTPGYYGAYEQDGVIVYGTGYVYDPYVGDVWIAAPATYGYAVNPAYNPWMGWGMGYCMGMAMSDTYYYNSYPYWGPYSAAYGPHGEAVWGPGGWAATTGDVYQHWGDVSTMTRSSAGYNAWTGREWGGTTATAYNSSTGARAAGQRGYVENAYTGQWAEGAHAAGYNPTTDNYAAGKAVAVGDNGDTKAVAAAGTVGNTATGNEVSAAGVKTENGTWGVAHGDDGTAVATGNNVYATNDGNVYKNTDGTWQSYDSGSWNNVNDANTKSQLDQQQATRNDGDWRSSMSGRWQQGGSGFDSGQGGAKTNSASNTNRSSGDAVNSWGGGGSNQNRSQGGANSGRFGRSGGGGSGGGGRR